MKVIFKVDKVNVNGRGKLIGCEVVVVVVVVVVVLVVVIVEDTGTF